MWGLCKAANCILNGSKNSFETSLNVSLSKDGTFFLNEILIDIH